MSADLPVQIVMAGLVPAIDVFEARESKTWMPGTRLRRRLRRVRSQPGV